MRCGITKSAAVISLIDALCQCRKLHQAKFLFQRLLFFFRSPEPSSPVCRLSTGFTRHAPHVFDEVSLSISTPSASSYNVIIQVLCSNGLVHDARSLMTAMIKCGYSLNPKSFTPLIGALLTPDHSSDAFCSFMDMLKSTTYVTPDLVLLAHDLLWLSIDACNIGAIRKLVVALYRCGHRLNVDYMRYVVKFMLLKGFFDECIGFIEEMRIMGYSFDARIYRLVIASLGVWGRVKDAKLMFGKMTDAIDQSYKVAIYNTLINSLCKVGLLEEARGVFSWMREDGISPNVVSYGTLVDGFCEFGKVDVASSLLDEMMDNGCIPNAVVYTLYMKGLCKLGMVDEALEVMRIMEECRCPPSLYTYNVLLYGLCKCERFIEVEKMIEEMKSRRVVPNIFTYESVIDGLRQSGNDCYSVMLFQRLAELWTGDSEDFCERLLLESFSSRRK